MCGAFLNVAKKKKKKKKKKADVVFKIAQFIFKYLLQAGGCQQIENLFMEMSVCYIND